MPAGNKNDGHSQARARIAEAVREACLEAAVGAYENARMSGLCAEGAWECAVGAVRTLDLERTVGSTRFDATQTDR